MKNISIIFCILCTVLLIGLLVVFLFAAQFVATHVRAEPPLAITQKNTPLAYRDPLPIVMSAANARERAVVLLKGSSFDVEVARTDADRQKGLSRHRPLAPNEGMLFLFDAPGRYGFWMKDMDFPIDIIWLDEKHSVTFTISRAMPESYPTVFTPPTDSAAVLEVPADTVERLGVRVGDKVVEKN